MRCVRWCGQVALLKHSDRLMYVDGGPAKLFALCMRDFVGLFAIKAYSERTADLRRRMLNTKASHMP